MTLRGQWYVWTGCAGVLRAHGSARPREGLRPLLPPLRRGGRDRPRGRRVAARPGRSAGSGFSRAGAEYPAPAQPTADRRPGAAPLALPERAGGGRGARAAVRLRRRLHRPHRPGARGHPARRADPRSPTGSTTARRWTRWRWSWSRGPAQGGRPGHGEPAPLGADGELRGHLRRALRGALRAPRGAGARGPGPAAARGDRGAELSVAERQDVTQRHFSYGEDDLVVVDWNAAFVYEPSGSRDIPDILEIANAQLLEFRYYDDAAGPKPGAGSTRRGEARATPARLSSAAPTARWPGRCWPPCWR